MVFPSVFIAKHMATINQRQTGIFSYDAAAKTQILRLKSINKPQKCVLTENLYGVSTIANFATGHDEAFNPFRCFNFIRILNFGA